MRLAVLVALVGCYSPTATVGLPCAANGACPSGQVCDTRTNRCGTGETPGDVGAIDTPPGATDARIDGPLPDGPGPNLSGCADGQREAFNDLVKFPRLAGCAAAWPGTPSLRAAATGGPCGDDLGACAVPASACATGWHLCGASGAIAEVAAIAVADCHAAAPTGRFIAALSHCADNTNLCTYDSSLPCYDSGWCSEAVCCGPGCSSGAGCADGIWAGATWISADNGVGCGAQPSAADLGVLCCAN